MNSKFLEDLIVALSSANVGVNIIIIGPEDMAEEEEKNPMSDFMDFEGIFGGGGGSGGPSESHLFGAADGGAFTF